MQDGKRNNNELLITSWIHLSHNDEKNIETSEWTMSGGAKITTGTRAVAILPDGTVNDYRYVKRYSYPIRPVFYLERGTTITSGTGNIDDPFIVNE